MTWISNLFARHGRRLHFLAIIFLSGALIIASSGLVPIVNQAILSVFHWPFAQLKTNLADLHAEAEENQRLRQALSEVSLSLTMCEEANREIARLRAILGFEPPPGYELHPVEVVSVTGDYFPTSVVISSGENDSLYSNQPVIDRQGLVGRIESVSKDFAIVQLLTDPANRVAARLATSREMGIVRFTVSRGMILDNFPINGTIEVGDTVLSSGLGGIYPAGLKVGTVQNVFRPELEPFCEIDITPAVNFFSIDELFVLRTISP